MISATTIETQSPARLGRIPLGDAMRFEILVNEKSQIWIFHDKALPYRLAWIEFDLTREVLELIPHDRGNGILYTDVPAALSARIRKAGLVYLYLTDGDKISGFQKIPIKTRIQ